MDRFWADSWGKEPMRWRPEEYQYYHFCTQQTGTHHSNTHRKAQSPEKHATIHFLLFLVLQLWHFPIVEKKHFKNHSRYLCKVAAGDQSMDMFIIRLLILKEKEKRTASVKSHLCLHKLLSSWKNGQMYFFQWFIQQHEGAIIYPVAFNVYRTELRVKKKRYSEIMYSSKTYKHKQLNYLEWVNQSLINFKSFVYFFIYLSWTSCSEMAGVYMFNCPLLDRFGITHNTCFKPSIVIR